jgi:hypothetical protein
MIIPYSALLLLVSMGSLSTVGCPSAPKQLLVELRHFSQKLLRGKASGGKMTPSHHDIDIQDESKPVAHWITWITVEIR